MKEIVKKSINEQKRFKKFGDSFEQVEDLGNHIYLYKRTFGPSNTFWCYELVKGVKYKNPSGEIVYIFPSSSHWGQYGFSLYSNTSRQKIESLVARLKTED